MLLPTCPRNVDGASPDKTKPPSSNIRRTPHTASPSTLFRSDPLPSGPSSSFNRSDQSPLIPKKRMKSLWVSFYDVVFIGVWVSKLLRPNRQAFVNILGRLLHVWWLLARGIQVRIFGQRLLIKVPVLRIWFSQHGLRRLWSEGKSILSNNIHRVPAQGKLAMQVIQAPIRKTVMLIHLQILDSIMGLRAHMMEKIRGLVGIHYQLQSNGAALLRRLSDGHAFLDPDLDKI